MTRLEWFAGVASRGLGEPAEVWAYGEEPAGPGVEAAAVVMVRRLALPDAYAFSTHLVVIPGSAPDAAYMVSGVYDCTAGEAWSDFVERCAALREPAPSTVAVSASAQAAGFTDGVAA